VFVPSGASQTREIERQIVGIARAMRTRIADWLRLLAEFDARDGTAGTRFCGTTEWLAWTCGMTARTARDHVRVSRRLREMPLVASAFADGELSYSQARAITRAAPAEDEAALLEVARRSTTAQLERHVRALRSAPSADLDVANEAHARRCVEWFHDVDGTLRFWGRLAGEAGVAFVEAVETAAAALHPEPVPGTATGGRRRPSRVARRADALTEIALSGSPRTHLVLHADLEALACTARGDERRTGATCSLEHGPAVPSDLARRLTCDAEVSVSGVDLGRTQRVVGPALRRALEARDGRCCAMPGCERRHGLAAHHIVHWAHGGATDLDNLVLLCAFHHRLLHEGGFGVRRRRGGPEFHDHRGRRLQATPDRAPPRAVAA